LFSVIALLLLALAGGLFTYINSPKFEEQARRYIVREIERRTGVKASLRSFGWDLWHQRFRLDDLTLRGLEAPEEAPLAHFERIDIGLNFRTLIQRRIDLFELTLLRPDFHVMVGQDGKTNIPSPEPAEQKPFNFQISIQNFTISGGSALLNEHQVNIDFSLANLAGVLDYQAAREVLATHIRYDGVYDSSSETKSSIPYTFSADMDYTRATLVAHRIVVNSGKSELTLHGRINDLLSRNISGKLEYTGSADIPFLNYFFRKERFAGKADVAGTMEFSRGYFFTHGKTDSNAVDFEGWHATKLTGEYAYHYPDRRLSFRNLKAAIIDGTLTGSVVVERLPGPSRVLLDLDYAGIDAAELARVYPWDPKYRIFANMTGTLNGWFEGKLQRYDLSGHADFQSYTPSNAADLVPIPLDGSTNYDVIPGQARVANADVRFYSTSVKADGLIDGISSDLKLVMNSSNLKDLAFLYSDANGSGSFDGILSGRIAKPILNGEFTLLNHVYGKWTIQQAAGSVNLDIEAESVKFRDTRVTQGESEILVNGTTALSGATSDLHVQSNRVIDRDLQPFLDRSVGGTFAGDLRVTSLSPTWRFEGDVHASNLSIDHRLIGDAKGHVRFLDPVVEVDGLSVKQNQSALSGDFAYNRVTSALKFSARASSVDFSLFRDLGLPESLTGFIRQAEFSGNGTTRQPNIQGNATVENLSFYGEVFPQTRVNLSSAGSKLNVRLDTGRNATLNAQIDTAVAGYPFTAQATFARYSLERVGGLSEGTTMIATGNASLSGILTDRTRLRGNGGIDSAEIRVQQTSLHTTKPFTFDFNSERLTVTGVTLAGEATQVNLAGTIGLVQRAPLNLDVSGRLDLALLSAAYPDWSSTGALNVEGRIGGTVQDPDLRGLAHLANASLGRRGFFTSLANLNGDLFFDQNRVTLNNVEGKVGGGVLKAQGNAVLQSGSIQAMNIRIEADAVRVRYPQGLRTILGGTMVLRGTSTSPVLEGNLQIQSLAYRNSFEEFLALVTERNTSNEPSPLGRLRLAMHVEGGRNITIQNQLADLEARINVDIKGTAADPSLTGHIEASGGTLLFQGNRYRITRGNIDFVDPLRIEPVVDVQAESEVRDYRVILAITGRGKQLHLEMRSDPPLPELEIVSLIAGGRTREEYAARPSPAVPTGEQLFQSGAASILFDLLQQRVGNRLGLLGLDRVRVNPLIVGRGNNPGARITLSEQVTPSLSITYSQDVSSNQEQVILIEYFVDRNTSIVASRDELGNLGLDVRKRKRF
jgi:translocation and assembly module TamB